MTVIDQLGLYLLKATQDAAVACLPWVARGDGKAADGAAVEAMRKALAEAPGSGTVVIGEGEKDEAPMLFNGEAVGSGRGELVFDLAVDPLEGTKACARGAEGAITVGAIAPAGTLWATTGWYMDKLIVGPQAAGRVDIDAPLEDNLAAVGEALGKPVEELCAIVLDKPRHVDLIERLRKTGAKVALIPDGDVLGALRVLLPDGDADLLVGIGGTPEGVLTACAVRVLGGDMQGALAPQSDHERELLARNGQEPGRRLTLDDLARSPDCCFVATAVTSSPLLQQPIPCQPTGWRTQSFVATPLHPGLIVDTCAEINSLT